jgi:hypothetical protein
LAPGSCVLRSGGCVPASADSMVCSHNTLVICTPHWAILPHIDSFLHTLTIDVKRIAFFPRLLLLFYLFSMTMFLLLCLTCLTLSSQIKIITPSVNNTLHSGSCFHPNSSKSSANMTSFILIRSQEEGLLPSQPFIFHQIFRSPSID